MHIYIASKKERKKERKFNDMHIYIASKKERKKEEKDRKKENGMCAQRRLRSAWASAQSDQASAQSDQSFRCPHEDGLGPYLPIERTSKTMIRLGGCPG